MKVTTASVRLVSSNVKHRSALVSPGTWHNLVCAVQSRDWPASHDEIKHGKRRSTLKINQVTLIMLVTLLETTWKAFRGQGVDWKNVMPFFLVFIIIVWGNLSLLTIVNQIQNAGDHYYSYPSEDSTIANESLSRCKRWAEARNKEPLNYHLKMFMIAVLALLFTVCVLGNLFTLVSLIYVKITYRDEFTDLKGSSTLLLFQLCFCDLMYGLIGFTHFIHGLSLEEEDNPFTKTHLGSQLCYGLAFLRNIFAEADFATMGENTF